MSTVFLPARIQICGTVIGLDQTFGQGIPQLGHAALEIALLLGEEAEALAELLVLLDRAQVHLADGLDPLADVGQALSALHLFARDRHYIVQEGTVRIVDEFTGRVMADRAWERGLHQMVELKEDCELTADRDRMISFKGEADE